MNSAQTSGDATATQQRLCDLSEPGTVSALLAGATASTLGFLFWLVVLLGNWAEPGCTLPEPIEDNAAYCAINGDDYVRALPAAAVTLMCVAFTVWVCVRVVRRTRAHGGSVRGVLWRVALLVGGPVVAIFVMLAVAAAPLLRESI
ncbi:hypothetical protein [Nocardioides aurantiacus]|uniref:Uncharacterized protein n=1 Tax=Nocardioides aurantiacus TaxID=86796 RepID=A0A3N2CUE6_9ACTN|nr:hypothetical protein [Nocardioides aurantiacus]ROR91028.1 hypothetical protein EDD33_1888 [Nocardioides aurantiacus]